MKVCSNGLGLTHLNFLLALREGAPRLSQQLAPMQSRTGSTGGMWKLSAAKYKNWSQRLYCSAKLCFQVKSKFSEQVHCTQDEELTDLSLIASLLLLATFLFCIRSFLYPTLRRNVVVLNCWLRLLLLLLTLDSCLYTFMFVQICLYYICVYIDYREFNFLFFPFGLGVCIDFAEPWQQVGNDG